MEVLTRFKLLYHEPVQGRFHLSYHERNPHQDVLEITPVTFVLLILTLIHRLQNMDTFNLAFFCKNNDGRVASPTSVSTCTSLSACL